MNNPWMLIAGFAIFGFFIPEAFAAFGNVRRTPLMMNVSCAIAAGLISASFV